MATPYSENSPVEAIEVTLRNAQGIEQVPIEMSRDTDGNFIMSVGQLSQQVLRANPPNDTLIYFTPRMATSPTDAASTSLDDGIFYLAKKRISIEPAKYKVICDDEILPALPLKEFKLLHHLASHAGKIVSRAELMRKVWGPGYENTQSQTLQTHITRLRGRLTEDLQSPKTGALRTIQGMGIMGVRSWGD